MQATVPVSPPARASHRAGPTPSLSHAAGGRGPGPVTRDSELARVLVSRAYSSQFSKPVQLDAGQCVLKVYILLHTITCITYYYTYYIHLHALHIIT